MIFGRSALQGGIAERNARIDPEHDLPNKQQAEVLATRAFVDPSDVYQKRMATTVGFVGISFITFVWRTNSMFFDAQSFGADLSRSLSDCAEVMNSAAARVPH